MNVNLAAPGGKGGTVEVSASAFGREYNEALVHQVVVAYMAAGRQGTRAQKTRAEVRGGGRKPFKQKGTGRARAGTIRSQHDGKLAFSEVSVDPTTGTYALRVVVPNPEQVLLPGMYVRVRIEQGRNDAALPLPQQAVTRNAQGDSVMVVDDKGAVAARPVKVAMGQGNRWIITEGLKPGERVIVEGFQKLRPGATVKTVPWNPPGSAPAAPRK